MISLPGPLPSLAKVRFSAISQGLTDEVADTLRGKLRELLEAEGYKTGRIVVMPSGSCGWLDVKIEVRPRHPGERGRGG
jgi:hypothetical protein